MSTTPKKTGPSMARGTSKQDYETPVDFMDAVKSRFGTIGFDLAASDLNAKAPRYFTEAVNSLIMPWHKAGCLEKGEWLFLNPPFSNIEPWAEKCAAEMKLGARILFLVPAAIGSNWYWKHVAPNAHVLALRQRISFDGKNSFPKDLLLCVFLAGLKGFQPWDWKGKRAK
jgi:phage N-6-adenine-methyltransferase